MYVVSIHYYRSLPKYGDSENPGNIKKGSTESLIILDPLWTDKISPLY